MQVDTVSIALEKRKKPNEIVKELKHQNPATFAGLTEQVVGRWIEGGSGETEWKESVLKNVAHGHSPAGATTRSGILVSGLFISMRLVIIMDRHHIRNYRRRS